ncbi:hypothetical protein H9P43_009842 [Blastocladiella emersonii ATCC 22665]|nr:hypothetical protein H9P43_009842 [Blastocladiella emersonii ATCC 22665]
MSNVKQAAEPAPASAAAAPAAPAIQLDAEGRPIKKSAKDMTKAERRAYQEAQRAAKEAMKAAGGSGKAPAGASAQAGGKKAAAQGAAGGDSKAAPSSAADTTAALGGSSSSLLRANSSVAGSVGNLTRPGTAAPAAAPASKTMSLFAHLPTPLHERKLAGYTASGPHSRALHPAVVQVGLQMADNRLGGSNARCRAMLEAFKNLIADYATPNDAVLSRHLTQHLGNHISYLSDIRPLSPGMGSAIRQLKHEISVLAPDLPDKDAKEQLLEHIDTFIQERITMALHGLAEIGVSKIKDGDVILTFGHSSTVRHVLLAAQARGRKFRAIVVDARPRLEGRRMARALLAAGIPTTYVLISGVAYAMREATKVLLGANGLLANGALLARAGSAQVALIAARANIPVIVTCETYKFSNAIHLDSIVFNELGDPSDLLRSVATTGPASKGAAPLKALNLLFDVTPPEFLTVVITELGLVPVTSVPVVLREYKPLLESHR